jgi:hypothetical protein
MPAAAVAANCLLLQRQLQQSEDCLAFVAASAVITIPASVSITAITVFVRTAAAIQTYTAMQEAFKMDLRCSSSGHLLRA